MGWFSRLFGNGVSKRPRERAITSQELVGAEESHRSTIDRLKKNRQSIDTTLDAILMIQRQLGDILSKEGTDGIADNEQDVRGAGQASTLIGGADGLHPEGNQSQ